MVSVYSREMNLLSISIIIILFCVGALYSQENTIAEDTFEPQLDKIAHLATSFGLYYTFHTMYQDSLLPVLHDSIPIELHSMLSATIVGFIYECYQATPMSRSDGISKHDMVYNMFGIGLARLTHEFFLYFKEVM